MKRWIQHAIFGTALAGCVQQDATQPQIETAEATTCPGPGNFPKAYLPATLKPFDGFVKQPGAGQYQLTIPNANQPGMSYVFLVDPVKGVIPWGATFKSGDLTDVHAASPDHPWLDITRPPPPPPPIGNGYLASFVLEYALAASTNYDVAATNTIVPP